MIEVTSINSKSVAVIESQPVSVRSDGLEEIIWKLDCEEEARNYRAFGALEPELPEERDIDYRFHVYGITRMSKRDMQKFNDRLNNGGGKDYNKRNRRYFYRTAL